MSLIVPVLCAAMIKHSCFLLGSYPDDTGQAVSQAEVPPVTVPILTRADGQTNSRLQGTGPPPIFVLQQQQMRSDLGNLKF